MRKLWVAFAAAIVAAGLGVGMAWAASGATTGTNVACATATASTPGRTLSVSGQAVFTQTIDGASQTASHCVTQTYAVPTSTVTSPGSTQTKTVTQTVTSQPTSSTSTTKSTASSTSTTSSTTTQSPPPASGVMVGSAADPKVTCDATASTVAAIYSDLSAAAAGSVVCLKPGTTFGNISFSTASSKAVTVDGQGDTVGNVTLDQTISNLTIQGMNARGFAVLDPSPGGLVFQYDTVSNVAKGIGFMLDSQAHGQSGPLSGVMMRYDQVDHVGECVNGDVIRDNITFSHSVCGPGIGFGDTQSTDPGHYMQTGGSGVTVTNDAFLGPACACASQVGLHLNVFHDLGSSSDITFSNNILWHTDALGQSILLQTGHFDNVVMDNNLSVDDPSSQNNSYAFWSTDAHGLDFSNNTVVHSHWGNLLTISQVSADYPAGTGQNYTINNNITANTAANPDFQSQECATACSMTGNVTDDTSAPGTNSTKNWVPAWQTTSWTPPSPYSPPPAGWYRPSGMSGAGYQGNVGP
jgi:hypothetical protein